LCHALCLIFWDALYLLCVSLRSFSSVSHASLVLLIFQQFDMLPFGFLTTLYVVLMLAGCGPQPGNVEDASCYLYYPARLPAPSFGRDGVLCVAERHPLLDGCSIGAGVEEEMGLGVQRLYSALGPHDAHT